MKKLITSIVATMLMTTVVEAQSVRNCGPRESVVERLHDGYGELAVSFGLAANGSLVETYVSAETGTWTIVITAASGVSCLVASGQSYEAIEGVAPIEGDDA